MSETWHFFKFSSTSALGPEKLLLVYLKKLLDDLAYTEVKKKQNSKSEAREYRSESSSL